MTNKKKFLIILGVILFGVILILVILKFSKEKKEEIPEEVRKEIVEIKKCPKIKDKKKREICEEEAWYHYAFHKANDLKLCTRFKFLGWRDQCIAHIIVTRNLSPEKCNLIASPEIREDFCFRELASKRELKKEGEGVKICDYIKNMAKREECKGLAKALRNEQEKNLKGCYHIHVGEYRMHCFRIIFLHEGLEYCKKLENKWEKDLCESLNYLVKAMGKEDEKICKNIPLLDYKKVCINVVMRKGKVSEVDSDKDRVDDINELIHELDPFNADSDGDGLKDGEELFDFHTEANEKDTDHDGLTDYEEVKIYQTNPANPDTDDDGILDGEEIKKGTDPVDGDKDKDGLPDEFEKKIGTYSTVPDSDNDGYKDGWEWERGYHPLKEGLVLADTDKDGLLDIDEIFYGTDRLNPDTDGDGVSDKKEVEELTNPLGEGDMDFDGDGLTDKEELKYGTNPSLPDTDNDGISDFEEVKGKKIEK